VGIGYRCDAALGCTFIVWDRDVTPDEWRDQFRRMSDDPAFPPGPLAITDLSTAGAAAQISPEVVKEMAAAVQQRAERMPPMRLAIVANGAWDKARQLERVVEGGGTTTIVFNDLETACTWLGLSSASARSVLDELRAELPPAT
jgi:hypothetical protein